jgi:hypothetical protein
MPTPTTATNQFIDLIKAINSLGNYGVVTLIVSLLTLIAVAVLLMWVQRQVIQKLNEAAAANSARVETFGAIEKGMRDYVEVIKATNDELRKDLERLKQKQEGLKQSLTDTITKGLTDLQSRLETASVRGILEQVPTAFRHDVEKELGEATDRAITDFLHRLRTDAIIAGELDPLRDEMKQVVPQIKSRLEQELGPMLEEMRRNVETELKREFEQQLVGAGVHPSVFADHLAERIALRLHHL